MPYEHPRPLVRPTIRASVLRCIGFVAQALARPPVASSTALLVSALLVPALCAAGCTEKNRPVKGRPDKPGASSPSDAMGTAPAIDPSRPGSSQAERSISQAMEIKRAEDALAAGHAERALGHLKQALELLPTSPRAAEIHLLVGRAHDQAGAGQQALAAFEKAVALEPGNPAGHYLLALSYKAAKDYPRAHEAIRKAIGLAPKNLAYRFDLVTIELAQDRKIEAERSFTEYEKRRDDLVAQLKAGGDPQVGGAGGQGTGTAGAKRDDRPRLLALSALAAVRADERILAALASVLGDPSPAIRTAAAQALGDSGSKDPKLRQALVDQVAKEQDAAVRKVLREALTRLPEPGPEPRPTEPRPEPRPAEPRPEPRPAKPRPEPRPAKPGNGPRPG